MLGAVVIGGYLLLTYKRPASSGTVPEVSPLTETGAAPELVPAAPSLDKKFKLSNCEAKLLDADIIAGKGECITVGSKHGIIVTLPDKRRCTILCSYIKTLTDSQRKKMGVSKCKCDALNRADLESALTSSSYARAYKVYIQRSLN